jgi:hypothetical protein
MDMRARMAPTTSSKAGRSGWLRDGLDHVPLILARATHDLGFITRGFMCYEHCWAVPPRAEGFLAYQGPEPPWRPSSHVPMAPSLPGGEFLRSPWLRASPGGDFLRSPWLRACPGDASLSWGRPGAFRRTSQPQAHPFGGVFSPSGGVHGRSVKPLIGASIEGFCCHITCGTGAFGPPRPRAVLGAASLGRRPRGRGACRSMGDRLSL